MLKQTSTLRRIPNIDSLHYHYKTKATLAATLMNIHDLNLSKLVCEQTKTQESFIRFTVFAADVVRGKKRLKS